MKKLRLLFVLLWMTSNLFSSPVTGLLERIDKGASSKFIIERQKSETDFFELDQKGDKVIIRGNDYVNIATGLNWYLKYYAGIHLSWNGMTAKLPAVLPPVTKKERHETDLPYRYDLNYCTFSYKGEVSAGAMELALSEVKLKNAKLAGMTWKLKPYNQEVEEQDPVRLVWESEKGIPLFGSFEMPVESVLKIALRMPLIAVGAENKVSATDMLGTVLKDVTFMEDGNIVATYKDAANGGTEWTKSPVNLAQYVVENDNQIKVFLNPAAIIAAVNNAGRAIDVQTVIQQAIQILYPMLVNGVPVAFEQTEDALSVYLNTELLLPLLKTLVVPLLSDEEVVAMLVELMKKDPDFGEMAGLAEPMLKAFPEIIESTTKVEIGLNFVK